MTYNIWGDVWEEENTRDLYDIVRREKVDILCLQEVVKTHRSDGVVKKKDLMKELLDVMGEEYDGFGFIPLQPKYRAVGNAILYRKNRLTKVGEEYKKHYPLLSQRGIIEEKVSKWLIPLRRIIIAQKFDVEGQTIIVYNVHLDIYGGDWRRIYQISKAFKFWEGDCQRSDVIEIVTGDFNTWLPFKLARVFHRFSGFWKFMKSRGFENFTDNIPWTYSLERKKAKEGVEKGAIEKGLADKVLSNLNYSYKQKLDHVWVRGDVEKRMSKRLDFDASDHLPVLSKMRIKENASKS